MFMGAWQDTLRAPLILLLDNKDSFVWNLAQALAALGEGVEVVRSGAVDVEAAGRYEAIVLSPGPGRPEDAGRCIAVVRRWSGARAILGVCLGHQAIAAAFGAAVVRTEPCHGRTSAVRHDGGELWRGVPDGAPFCRYHSLCVDPATLPRDLIADARTDDGVIMGLRHAAHPTFGVQFHPESFRSPLGRTLLANFLREAA
jgi:anthranilate synthase/aminodeoxychorismate synthase-like glutamine amidotransferase